MHVATSAYIAAAHLWLLTSCRDIVFPPLGAIEAPGQVLFSQPVPGPGNEAENKFAGLTTFANLNWVHCLSSEDDIEPYDIAILGAPFDTATTARPGARFGPSGIRWGSRRISPNTYGAYTHENHFKSWAKVIDCGDAPLTFLDNTVALKQLGKAHKVVSGRNANNSDVSSTPRIIVLGGDHTTTLAALRSTIDHWGPVSVVHFDSHLDTWNPDVLGGGLSHYAGVNHGTFLHIAHEEGLLLNGSSIHAGIRAPAFNNSDWKNDARCGFTVVTAREIDHIGIGGIVERIKSRVGDTPTYISVDIDVLDPAHAPGTGTAEVGGWTTRELLSILDSLVGVNVIGADLVEVSPIYDNPGEVTVLAASEVVSSLIRLMVKQPVKSMNEI